MPWWSLGASILEILSWRGSLWQQKTQPMGNWGQIGKTLQGYQLQEARILLFGRSGWTEARTPLERWAPKEILLVNDGSALWKAAMDEIPRRMKFSILVCVYYFMFECFNNLLESTLVLHLCAILGRVCVFLFPKALALGHVPYLWTNVCISLDFQIYIWCIFMYVHSCMRILHSFMHSSRMIHERQTSMDR